MEYEMIDFSVGCFSFSLELRLLSGSGTQKLAGIGEERSRYSVDMVN